MPIHTNGSRRRQNPAAQLLTVTWNGSEWKVDCPVPSDRLQINASVTVPIPPDLLLTRPRREGERFLFKIETKLYLRFQPNQITELLEQQLQAYYTPMGRSPKDSNGFLLYPIVLKEDFYIYKTKPARNTRTDEDRVGSTGGGEDIENWRSCNCQCVLPIEEEQYKEFPSLNKAAKYAFKKWTDSKDGAVNVFDRVLFDYHCGLLQIDCQRRAVLNQDALPNPRLRQLELF